MSTPQKIEPCDVCGGAGGLESFSIAGTPPAAFHGDIIRWRVKCAKCGHMTPHFAQSCLALAVWNGDRAGQGADKLAG
jgi:hypothetical protein